MSKSRETLGQRHYSFWASRLLDYDQSYVYVIRGGKKTPVKIGVAKKPLQRLKTLQTGNPQTLRLLLVVPGDDLLESILHNRFAEYRLKGSEWFYGPGVEEVIRFVTDLAVEMVRLFDGNDVPPLRHYGGWTDTERLRLQPAPPRQRPVNLPGPDLSDSEKRLIEARVRAAGERVPSYVPTIHERVARRVIRTGTIPGRVRRAPLSQ